MEFFQTVKQIGIFMICAQAILHFKPSAKYEKYLKLLISVMVLVQILVPIVDFFSGKASEEFYARMESIQEEISHEMEQLELENAMKEDILVEIEQEIKTKINNVASKYELAVTYIQVQQTEMAEKLVIYVQEKEKMQGISIQNIHIESINSEGNISSMELTEQEELREKEKLQMLSKEISVELGVSEEEIEVRWYE